MSNFKTLKQLCEENPNLNNHILSMKNTIENLNTIINYAAGYISACEQFRDKHPNNVKNWLFEGLK